MVNDGEEVFDVQRHVTLLPFASTTQFIIYSRYCLKNTIVATPTPEFHSGPFQEVRWWLSLRGLDHTYFSVDLFPCCTAHEVSPRDSLSFHSSLPTCSPKKTPSGTGSWTRCALRTWTILCHTIGFPPPTTRKIRRWQSQSKASASAQNVFLFKMIPVIPTEVD